MIKTNHLRFSQEDKPCPPPSEKKAQKAQKPSGGGKTGGGKSGGQAGELKAGGCCLVA
jgi:hypothetical protein